MSQGNTYRAKTFFRPIKILGLLYLMSIAIIIFFLATTFKLLWILATLIFMIWLYLILDVLFSTVTIFPTKIISKTLFKKTEINLNQIKLKQFYITYGRFSYIPLTSKNKDKTYFFANKRMCISTNKNYHFNSIYSKKYKRIKMDYSPLLYSELKAFLNYKVNCENK